MKRVLRLALAAIGLLAGPAIAQQRYTPTGIWRDDWEEDFYERWYGNQLRAMGEPILRTAADRGRFVRRLRVLVLPSFQPAYALRIDESGSGGIVTFVTLDGRGGYAPGDVAIRRHYRLTADEMREVNELLRRHRLTALPARERDPNSGDPQAVVLCPDATNFAFELLDARSSRFVQSSTCDDTPAVYAILHGIMELRPDRRQREAR